MPRYFFNTHIGRDIIKDLGGTVLRDPDQAWEVARDTAQEMMGDPANQVRLLPAILVVTDDEGVVVLEVPFAEAATLPPRDTGTVH